MNETTQAERIARWQTNVDAAQAAYDVARGALAFHERHDHILSVEERRMLVQRINVAQDDLERAQYYLRRAKVGL